MATKAGLTSACIRSQQRRGWMSKSVARLALRIALVSYKGASVSLNAFVPKLFGSKLYMAAGHAGL